MVLKLSDDALSLDDAGVIALGCGTNVKDVRIGSTYGLSLVDAVIA